MQQSEASFSSQQRPRETAEVSAEPEAERDPPAEPQTFKEKVLDKLKGMSIMPSPERALETCQEDTGAFDGKDVFNICHPVRWTRHSGLWVFVRAGRRFCCR